MLAGEDTSQGPTGSQEESDIGGEHTGQLTTEEELE